jgi:hypothetical protein
MIVELLSKYATTAMLFIAAFYGLLAASGLINMYLRFIDHLEIEGSDKSALQKNAGLFVVLLASVYILKTIAPEMGVVVLLIVVLAFQMSKVAGLVRKLQV